MNYFKSAWQKWRGLSLEWQILISGGLVWAGGLAAGLPALPVTATRFFFSTYGSALLVAVFVQLGTFAMLRRYRRGAQPYLLGRGMPLFLVVTYLYYQFKSWTPLINARQYDAFYQRTDDVLWFIRDNIIRSREWVTAHIATNIDPVYYLMFLLMFMAAFLVYGIFGTALQQRRLILGLYMALLIGGVGYWVAPAAGPFIYRSLAGEGLANTQRVMLEQYQYTRDTKIFPDGYFGAALGAMPSMHFAFAIFFLLFTLRTKRWLSWLYVVILAWFFVDSVYLGWHYLIDILGGAIVAVASFYLTQRLLPERPKQNTPRFINA
jgi:membrane-associated phospholipid phosphatase